jgi:hypothetical protein
MFFTFASYKEQVVFVPHKHYICCIITADHTKLYQSLFMRLNNRKDMWNRLTPHCKEHVPTVKDPQLMASELLQIPSGIG